MRELFAKRARLHRRKQRVRGVVSGTRSVPRLSVSKSNSYIYCQLIDDGAGITLFGVHSKSVSDTRNTDVDVAHKLGELIGKKALEKNIYKVVFDRRGRKYTGKVSAVADGARQAGLKV